MNPIDAASLGVRLGTGALGGASKSQTGTAENDGAFGNIFKSVSQQVTKMDNDAQSSVVGLLNGQGVEVHDAMIATQRSELAFELALQVRNKAVSAYQQMMQMQF